MKSLGAWVSFCGISWPFSNVCNSDFILKPSIFHVLSVPVIILILSFLISNSIFFACDSVMSLDPTKKNHRFGTQSGYWTLHDTLLGQGYLALASNASGDPWGWRKKVESKTSNKRGWFWWRTVWIELNRLETSTFPRYPGVGGGEGSLASENATPPSENLFFVLSCLFCVALSCIVCVRCQVVSVKDALFLVQCGDEPNVPKDEDLLTCSCCDVLIASVLSTSTLCLWGSVPCLPSRSWGWFLEHPMAQCATWPNASWGLLPCACFFARWKGFFSISCFFFDSAETLA